MNGKEIKDRKPSYFVAFRCFFSFISFIFFIFPSLSSWQVRPHARASLDPKGSEDPWHTLTPGQKCNLYYDPPDRTPAKTDLIFPDPV